MKLQSIAMVFWLALLVPVLGTGAAAQEAMETISLEHAVELALLHSPQLAQTQASVLNAGSTRRRAWGSFLPTVSVGSGASVNSQDRFDPNTQLWLSGSSDSYSASVSTSYQIFQGGRKYSELARTSSVQLEAEARLMTQRYSVVLRTSTLFVNALRQSDLAEVADSSVARAEKSLEITRARMQAGGGDAVGHPSHASGTDERAPVPPAVTEPAPRRAVRAGPAGGGERPGGSRRAGQPGSGAAGAERGRDHRDSRVHVAHGSRRGSRRVRGQLLAGEREEFLSTVPVCFIQLFVVQPGTVA